MEHHVVLGNGLRVAAAPRRTGGLVAVYLWIAAGTADEGAGGQGAAHLLEHMLFKGTPRRGVGEAAGEIEGLGGDLNAFTSHDETVLHATLEADAWEDGLEIVADMARHAVVDAAELERERQVVLEEIRGHEDDPDTVLEETSRARLYPGHPYGERILGSREGVARVSREELLAFRDRHYVADRIVLAVAGDVAPEVVHRAAERHLGDWTRGGPRVALPPAPAARTGAVRVDRGFESSVVEIAFPAVPLGHPDVAALDVLAAALGEGHASVLTSRLQLDEALATDVWAGLSAKPAGGHLSVGFEPREGATAPALREALAAIAEIGRRGLPGSVVLRAREAVLADFLFATETVDGLAHDLAWYTTHFGGWEARARYRRAIAAVEPDDLRRVAARWLRPQSAVVVAVDGATSTRALAATTRRAAATPPPAPRADREVRRLPNGVRLLVLPDDGPVVGVRAVAEGGALAESPRTAGMAHAWSQMLTAGAGDLAPDELAEAIDEVSGEIEGLAGRDGMGLRATFPAAYATEGLDLVGATLAEPWFERQEWDRVRDELLEEVRTVRDRPGEVAQNATWAALYPSHPWRLPPGGTEASLGRLGAGALRRLHDRILTGRNLVVAVAGPVTADDAIDVLAPWLRELPGGGARIGPRPRPGAPRTRLRELHAGREQCTVQLGVRVGGTRDPDRLALGVLAAILGGQGGRLFLALREREGLGYAVWADPAEGVDGGVLTLGLSTEPGREVEALRALRAEVARLRDAPPTGAETLRYRRMLQGHAAMALQRASGRAGDAAVGLRFALPWGLDAHRAALASVTPEAVATLARRLAAAPWVPVVVHPGA